MKYKIGLFLITFFFIFGVLAGIYINTDIALDDIPEKIIRLHVVANSDSPADQQLKLQVRDNVIGRMNGKFGGLKDISEVKRIIDSIANTSSRNEKEAILKQNKNNELLKDIFYFVFNPYILTGLSTKKINKKVKEKGSIYYNFNEVKNYILQHNTGTDYDIATVQNFIKNKPPANLKYLHRNLVN